MIESKWTRKVCEDLKRQNAKVVAFVGQIMQESGIPDRYVCHRLWQGFLEFKGIKTKLQLHQEIFIREISARGGNAYVVRFPGIVEDSRGIVLGKFTDAIGLLRLLANLSKR